MPPGIGLYVSPARWLTMAWTWDLCDQKWHDWVILHWILYWCTYFSSNLYYPTFIPVVVFIWLYLVDSFYIDLLVFIPFSPLVHLHPPFCFLLFFLLFSLHSLPPQLPHVNVMLCSLTSLTPPSTSTQVWHKSQRWDYSRAHNCGR